MVLGGGFHLKSRFKEYEETEESIKKNRIRDERKADRKILYWTLYGHQSV